MNVIAIPKNLIKNDDLVVLPRKMYERFLKLEEKIQEEKVTERNILSWSREAKKLKKESKLSTFNSLIRKEYPVLAKKYGTK